MPISIKIHESEFRKLIAICDSDIIGKKFEDEKLQLDVKHSFYNGEIKSEKEILKLIKKWAVENSTFNIVGRESVNLCVLAKLIDAKGVIEISGIPHAMVL